MPPFSQDLQTLAEWMTGSFSSQAQAAVNPAFFDVRLQMHRIWRARTDGIWLYVEQAAAKNPDAPYRQRVYRLTSLPSGQIKSTMFSLGTPEACINLHLYPEKEAALTEEMLELIPGCDVHLSRQDENTFLGETQGKDCANAWKGARYATSTAIITPTQMTSWDRGYNDEDTQVWGSTEGPYIFEKISLL